MRVPESRTHVWLAVSYGALSTSPPRDTTGSYASFGFGRSMRLVESHRKLSGDDPESDSMNAAPLPVDRVHRYASGRAEALVGASSDAGPSLSRNES
ncbi:hypothetical protein EAG_04459 [Camponotus floridanus]|uniref:Uncharacterized protein n=1 Tax=Camponotus floridanus TaxID=104421 RepID=E1ZXJ0_CAMFO|nr:hypothetical protein EAG_04459 [Camponotus floridanus]